MKLIQTSFPAIVISGLALLSGECRWCLESFNNVGLGVMLSFAETTLQAPLLEAQGGAQ